MNSGAYKKKTKIIWHNITVQRKGMQRSQWIFGKV